MIPPACLPMLTEPQLAALAKVACGAETGGGITLLVGPPGVGKTILLTRLAAELSGAASVQPTSAWLAVPPADLPPTMLVDDAHLASESDLTSLFLHARSRRPEAALVLAGQGRLLTLVARDTRLEQAIRIRATLLPGGLADTQQLIESELVSLGNKAVEAVTTTIHDITGGVPAAILRLMELATVVATARPDSPLAEADIEAIHRRLSPLAA